MQIAIMVGGGGGTSPINNNVSNINNTSSPTSQNNTPQSFAQFANAPHNGGISYIQADATNLEILDDESIQSISALCSVEHFGLGRYGDPIDPDAWAKALRAFQRVLKSGGRMYISVPVGKVNKVCFNAHRVFTAQKIIDTLDKCDIMEFSYIKGFDTVICMERVRSETLLGDVKGRGFKSNLGTLYGSGRNLDSDNSNNTNGELKIYKENLDSIPDLLNNGVVGLFEFIKR